MQTGEGDRLSLTLCFPDGSFRPGRAIWVINEINGKALPIRNINNSICNRSQGDKLTGYTQLQGMSLGAGLVNCHFEETWMIFSLSERGVAKYHPNSEKV